MLEFGFNATDYGKVVLAACFVTDLGTVLMLGLIFAPFTIKTLIFVGVCIAVLIFLPWITAQFFRLYGGRPSELETKYLLLLLFALGRACWLGRQRSCTSRLPHWDDPCGQRRQRSHFDPKTAYLVLWISHTVLFHSGWFLCLRTRFDRCTSSVSCDACGQAGHQNSGRLSGYSCFWLTAQGRDVHHAFDVHGADFRYYFVAVRIVAWHHRSGPVLRTGRSR